MVSNVQSMYKSLEDTDMSNVQSFMAKAREDGLGDLLGVLDRPRDQ
jgi:hypothetical protein